MVYMILSAKINPLYTSSKHLTNLKPLLAFGMSSTVNISFSSWRTGMQTIQNLYLLSEGLCEFIPQITSLTWSGQCLAKVHISMRGWSQGNYGRMMKIRKQAVVAEIICDLCCSMTELKTLKIKKIVFHCFQVQLSCT